MSRNSQDVAGIAPIFISVQQAADALSVTRWSVYQLLDRGEVVSQYFGRRRLVSVESLREYAANLPTSPDVAASG